MNVKLSDLERKILKGLVYLWMVACTAVLCLQVAQVQQLQADRDLLFEAVARLTIDNMEGDTWSR